MRAVGSGGGGEEADTPMTTPGEGDGSIYGEGRCCSHMRNSLQNC